MRAVTAWMYRASYDRLHKSAEKFDVRPSLTVQVDLSAIPQGQTRLIEAFGARAFLLQRRWIDAGRAGNRHPRDKARRSMVVQARLGSMPVRRRLSFHTLVSGDVGF
ncbi:MAG: hypothetical protein ACI9BW_003755 [Gammaproteobacteria bacterium]|jgi:hypothetical protein